MTLTARDVKTIGGQLSDHAGKKHVQTGSAIASYSAHGERPLAVVAPGNEGEAVEVVNVANRNSIPVVVWGGGTKQDLEPVQPRDGLVLRTARFTAVDLDAANLTVTVGAGKVLDDLQRDLAAERLFLPLDPVDSASSTVGGTLATNGSGPSRLLYRTARDMVLGLRVVTPLGTAIKVGGKTVKDVAGYDLKKLYIGSWGTLGAITEATFRLLPLPEGGSTVLMAFASLPAACSTVSDILSSFMRPSTADLLTENALTPELKETLGLRSDQYLLLVAVEGAVEAVERQKRELLEMASKHRAVESGAIEGDDETALWRARRGVLAQPPSDIPTMAVKASVSLQRVLDFTAGLATLAESARVAFAAHAGNGIVYAQVSASEPGQLAELAGRIQRMAAECGGFAVVQRAPRELAEVAGVWPPRTDYGVMKRIKAELDPLNLWSPARTPGGRQ